MKKLELLIIIFTCIALVSCTGRHFDEGSINQILMGSSDTVGAPHETCDAIGCPEPDTSDPDRTDSDEPEKTDEYILASDTPVSTFSSDADTGSYSIMRSSIRLGFVPKKSQIRVEEYLNYFNYETINYNKSHPITITTEYAESPWSDNQLLRVMLSTPFKKRTKPANLVFLVDVSGSMGDSDKLPLVRKSLKMLVNNLKSTDRISIVSYAGGAKQVLGSTLLKYKGNINGAIEKLRYGGSTNGSAGIKLAYNIAQKNYIKEGINRVILASDGDFNVGISSVEELKKLIAFKASEGVSLTTLAFGKYRYNDEIMEQLADNGDGVYSYIDNISEAKRVLVEGIEGTLETLAKDTKIQIEFNDKAVHSYRLIGYANRRLNDDEFKDDRKDAGDIGVGHQVTAFYEIRPIVPFAHKLDMANIKVRYKNPGSSISVLMDKGVKNEFCPFEHASTNFKFSSAVVGYGELLKGSLHKGNLSYPQLAEIVSKNTLNKGVHDKYRLEFIELIHQASKINNSLEAAKN